MTQVVSVKLTFWNDTVNYVIGQCNCVAMGLAMMQSIIIGIVLIGKVLWPT